MNLDSGQLWGTILAMGAGTLLIRMSFVVGMGGREPSAWMRRCLRPVPAAVLSALVAPAIFLAETPDGMLVSPRLVAGVLAAGVAWRWRNPFVVIAAGMAMLWGLQLWWGA